MNRYYIANEEIMHDNTLNNYIFGAISQGMLFAEALSLKDRIITDPMPSAGYYLQDIIRAMNENKLVTINYQRFEDDEPKEHTLQPYFLKTFKFRWYLFGMIDNKIRTYALDRIIGMKTEEENFVMDKRITADEYFKYAFGIYVMENVDPEEVVIEVTENESLYMETLPWHQSQQRIGVEDGKVIYKFRLNPTNDFISHIIGRQDRVKVTSPQSLVDTILDRLRAILALYV
jgi:predicted DNA-binding transcriptional regulator YafY